MTRPTTITLLAASAAAILLFLIFSGNLCVGFLCNKQGADAIKDIFTEDDKPEGFCGNCV